MKRLFVLLLIWSLLAGCGRKEEPVADQAVLVQAGAYTLSDGTTVDICQAEVFEDMIY